MCTVHAPHWATPQPYFVPVKRSPARSAQSSGVSGSTSTARDAPFTRNVTMSSPPAASLSSTPPLHAHGGILLQVDSAGRGARMKRSWRKVIREGERSECRLDRRGLVNAPATHRNLHDLPLGLLTCSQVKLPSDVGPILIIVSRDEPWLCQVIKDQFADDERVEVLLDRRCGERRQQDVPPTSERRQRERRQTDVGSTVRFRGWAVVHYRHDAPDSRDARTPPFVAGRAEPMQQDG